MRDVLGDPGQLAAPVWASFFSSLMWRNPPGPSAMWPVGPSAVQAPFMPACGLDATSQMSTGPAVVAVQLGDAAETQLMGQLGPGAAGPPGWPGPGARGLLSSGPPTTAAAARRTGHSGTKTAGPAAAATRVQHPASLQGLAHSPSSQRGGWHAAAGHPAEKERSISTSAPGVLASLNTISHKWAAEG